jgi:hypothetical protein
MLRIFERRILRMIYFPIKDNGIWRTRYNSELNKLCDELEVVKKIKIGILKWLIHVFRVQDLILTESLLFLNQKLRWLESVEKDLKNMDVSNWRPK